MRIRSCESRESRQSRESCRVARADYEWSVMSDHDKNRREFCAVMVGEVDEDGCFDLNTATIIKRYK